MRKAVKGRNGKIVANVTHDAAHLDEVAAYSALVHFGGEKAPLFSGSDLSSVKIKNAIGILGGEFDEHGDNGRKEMSAFAMVVKKLGIDSQYNVRKILDFINRVDSGAGSHQFDISRLLLNIHTAYRDSKQGIEWAMAILESYWNDENYFKRPAEECGKLFARIGAGWLDARFGDKTLFNKEAIMQRVQERISKKWYCVSRSWQKEEYADDPVINSLSRFFTNDCGLMLDPFCLPRAIASVVATKGLDIAIALAFQAISAKYSAEKSIIKTSPILLDGDRFYAGKYKVFGLTTESKGAKDAIFRTLPADIIILKNSKTGQVQIFSRISSGVNFDRLASAIRKEELALAEDHKNYFVSELIKDGNSCGISNWYYIKPQKQGNRTIGSFMLLNGSDSYPQIPATGIEWNRLKEIVSNSFE